MLGTAIFFCTNCLNGAANQANAYINIRHTKSVTDNLNLGTEVFKTALELAGSTEELYNYINTIKLTDDDVKRFIAKTILTDAEYKALNDYDKDNGVRKLLNRNGLTLEATNISTRKTNQIVSSYEYYNQGFGQEEIMGTAWGAYKEIYVQGLISSPYETVFTAIVKNYNQRVNVKLIANQAAGHAILVKGWWT